MTDKKVLTALEAMQHLAAAGAKSGPAWTRVRAKVLKAIRSHDVRSDARLDA